MDQLDTLLQRLTAAQHALIEDAAKADMLPSDGVIRKIADLENTIAAICALQQERVAAPQAGDDTNGQV